MPIDEKKLRTILTEHVEDLKRHVAVRVGETDQKIEVAREDLKRHVGVLVEESDRKFELIQEGFQGLTDKMDQLREDFAAIRKEIEEIRLHLFRKADLDRLEALEQRVSVLEKRLPRN